jgi:hypothetical protein
MLNRRGEPGAAGRLARAARSTSQQPGGSPDAVRRFAEHAARKRFAPFSLLAPPRGSWLLANDGAGVREAFPIAPGWHAITHADLDDAATTHALAHRRLGRRARGEADAASSTCCAPTVTGPRRRQALRRSAPGP